MAWNQILGHDRIKKILQRSILDGRIAGAYCFVGIEGTGKEAMALEFAKTCNCLNAVKSEDSIEACGECKSCKEYYRLSQSNLHLVFPLPTGRGQDSKPDNPYDKLTNEQFQEIRTEIEAKSEDPYHKIGLQGANFIRINQIRSLKKQLSLSATGPGRRFVIIFSADKMNTEAANAFLKTLEEPHDNVTIILVSSRPESLLPTILSRCQKLKFEPLSESKIANDIAERFDVPIARAQLAAAFSQGSYTAAISFLGDEMHQLRDEAIDLLRASVKKKNYRSDILQRVNEIVKSKDKVRLQAVLNILQMWFRDALVFKNGSEDGVINSDMKGVLSKFADFYDTDGITNAIKQIERHSGMIDKNVNQQLIMLSAISSIRIELMRFD